jgi:uncharacterized protein YndB with AHSA1/START domain
MSERLELNISRIIPAPAKAVFEAWLDPVALAKFIKPMAGMPDCTVEIDAQEGGEFLIIMKAGDQDLPHRGEYKTIQPYEKLAFTWLSDYTIPDSLVTLTFKELGPDDTELTLHHVGFPNDQARTNHEDGWDSIVEHLTEFVA